MGTRIRIKRGTESQITGYTGPHYEGELAFATNTGGVFVNDGTQFISVGGGIPTLQSVTDEGNTTTNSIGIGTTNPSAYYSNKLVVGAPDENGITLAATTTSAVNHIMFADGTTGSETYRGYLSYNHLEDSMRFGTGGSERMRITLTGNVGIGTTAPSEKLEVVGYAKASTGFKIGNYNLINSGGDGLNINSSAYYPLRFLTNNAERMRISEAGNVSIGTTAPVEKVHINGNLRIGLIGNTGYYISWGQNEVGSTGDFARIQGIRTSGAGNQAGHLTFQTKPPLSGNSPTERLRITDTGNVGIGTTSPTGKLHVVGTTSIIDSTLKLGNRTGSNGALILQGNNGPNFTIEGVNDTLDFSLVTGNPNGGVIQFSDAIKNVWFANSVGGTFAVRRANSANTDNNFGGIFVESQATTTSNGRAIYVSADNNGGIIRSTSYGGTGTTGLLQFQVGGNTSLPETKMVMDASGSVGIGTTAPSQKLDVNGYIASSRLVGRSTTGLIAGSHVASSYALGVQYNSNQSATSGDKSILNAFGNWNPSSGLANFNGITVSPTLNQTGTALGGARGFYYNPTVTSVLGTHRAIETTAGDVIFNGGNVGIGTTSPIQALHINKTNPYIQIQDSSAGTRADISGGIIIKDSTGAQSFGITQSNSVDVEIRANAGDLSLGTFAGTVIKLDGSKVGIGTTSPAAKLDVVGTIKLDDGGGSVYVGNAAGYNDDKTFNYNVGIGDNALAANTSGNNNIAVGAYALYNPTNVSGNIAIGGGALGDTTTGYRNTAVGHLAHSLNTSGYENVAIGHNALGSATSPYQSVAVGSYALGNANGVASDNTGIGYSAMSLLTTGRYNTSLGTYALSDTVLGSNNTAVGYYAGGGDYQGTNSVYLGMNTAPNSTNETNQVVIGYGATGNGSNSVTIGNTSITKTIMQEGVGVGVASPTSSVHIDGAAMRQLRINTPGGPTSSADTTGNIGDIAYDDLYFYIKTINGWGRVPLDFGF